MIKENKPYHFSAVFCILTPSITRSYRFYLSRTNLRRPISARAAINETYRSAHVPQVSKTWPNHKTKASVLVKLRRFNCGFTGVPDARTQLTGADTNYHTAIYGYLDAVAALDRAIGDRALQSLSAKSTIDSCITVFDPEKLDIATFLKPK